MTDAIFTNLTSDTMDETSFYHLAKKLLQHVQNRLDALDPDVVEATSDGDVIKISFASGAPFILNTQRPVRELWLAADRQAWHFRFDGQKWICPKTSDELLSRLQQLIQQRSGLDVVF